jgi:FADH2 O2-dependent halogenase
MLERSTHPRFAIGESSTPLADFKLAAIADHFGLDWLRPFAKYGTWKGTYPGLDCGLKRGFSFFRHELGHAFVPAPQNANSLLVSASPNDDRADTHWFRADFDAHLVSRAVAAGVPHLDRLEVHSIQHDDRGWALTASQPDEEIQVRAGFLIDATGTGQALASVLGVQQVPPTSLWAHSRALYSHFTGVARWQDVLEATNCPAATAEHPFPCDAAALHQIIDGGWMWILRFDGGVTSAGFSLDPDRHPVRPGESPEAEWARLLSMYPSLQQQFAEAVAVRPFVRTGRLQRRLAQAAGPDWAMLPHTVGFLDAWLSPGIAQTLFAVNRLGRILAEERPGPKRERRLAQYDRAVLRELAWVDEITGTCFRCFDRFPVMATVTMLYFTAAVYCEERERHGRSGPDDAFLLADDPVYRELAARAFQKALTIPASEAARFMTEVHNALGPYNLCRLCDLDRCNMYPFVDTLSHGNG